MRKQQDCELICVLKGVSKLLQYCSKYSLKMTVRRFCHTSVSTIISVQSISQRIMREIKNKKAPFLHRSKKGEQISQDRARAVRLTAHPQQAGEEPLCSSGSSGHCTVNGSQKTISYYCTDSWFTAQNNHPEKIQSSWLSHLLSRQWSCPCSNRFMIFVN